MKTDLLAARVHDAFAAIGVPSYPAQRIAARVAAGAFAAARPSHRRTPVVIAVGGLTLLAALAVAVPANHDAVTRTMERLTGQHFDRVRTYEKMHMTLAEARTHTTFPIVVPGVNRVVDAFPAPKNEGVILVVAVDAHAQASLTETWANARRPAWSEKLEGVGIHDDGSVRRFPVQRWRIGKIAFSVPVWTPAYRRYARELELATREAAARDGVSR